MGCLTFQQAYALIPEILKHEVAKMEGNVVYVVCLRSGDRRSPVHAFATREGAQRWCESRDREWRLLGGSAEIVEMRVIPDDEIVSLTV